MFNKCFHIFKNVLQKNHPPEKLIYIQYQVDVSFLYPQKNTLSEWSQIGHIVYVILCNCMLIR